MDKVLVEIFLPAADDSFDVYIPRSSRLGEILGLVSGVLGDLSGGKFKATPESVLCDYKSGIIFNINRTVAELGIENGSQLMLI